jgi:hypothetical protein
VLREVVNPVVEPKAQSPKPKLQAPSVDRRLVSEALTGEPIVIRFGYQWPRKDDERADIWRCVREGVGKVLEECRKVRARREGGDQLKLSFGRLRARHGTTVIGSIVGRIRQADILIFDLADFNHNVLFELGCAIGHHGLDSERIYILGTNATLKKLPSDLNGVFLSIYRRDDGLKACRLEELRTFQTTLRGSITELAQQRGMWGEKRGRSELSSE